MEKSPNCHAKRRETNLSGWKNNLGKPFMQMNNDAINSWLTCRKGHKALATPLIMSYDTLNAGWVDFLGQSNCV